MTTVTVCSSDNKWLPLPWNFAKSLHFAKSFDNRRWDAANKVWEIPMTEAEIATEIEWENKAEEIREYLEQCNRSFQGIAFIPYPVRGQQFAFSESDMNYLVGLLDKGGWELAYDAIDQAVSEYYERI
jgi:hypothetical protein